MFVAHIFRSLFCPRVLAREGLDPVSSLFFQILFHSSLLCSVSVSVPAYCYTGTSLKAKLVLALQPGLQKINEGGASLEEELFQASSVKYAVV